MVQVYSTIHEEDCIVYERDFFYDGDCTMGTIYEKNCNYKELYVKVTVHKRDTPFHHSPQNFTLKLKPKHT